MRRKRSHSQASGLSSSRVQRFPSTQLDVDRLERTQATRHRNRASSNAYKGTPVLRHARAISQGATIPVSKRRPSAPFPRTGEAPTGRGSPCDRSQAGPDHQTIGQGGKGDLDTSSRRHPNEPASGLRNSRSQNSHDVNGNAPRSNNARVLRDSNGSHYKTCIRRRYRCHDRNMHDYNFIKLPVHSVLKIEAQEKPRRRRVVKSRERSYPSDCQHLSSPTSCPRSKKSSSKSQVSFTTRKHGEHAESRYRVTPCPSNGACMSRSGSVWSDYWGRSRRSRSPSVRLNSTSSHSNISHSNSSRTYRPRRRSSRQTFRSRHGYNPKIRSSYRQTGHRRRHKGRRSQRQSRDTSSTRAESLKSILSQVSSLWRDDDVPRRNGGRRRSVSKSRTTVTPNKVIKEVSRVTDDRRNRRRYKKDREHTSKKTTQEKKGFICSIM